MPHFRRQQGPGLNLQGRRDAAQSRDRGLTQSALDSRKVPLVDAGTRRQGRER